MGFVSKVSRRETTLVEFKSNCLCLVSNIFQCKENCLAIVDFAKSLTFQAISSFLKSDSSDLAISLFLFK